MLSLVVSIRLVLTSLIITPHQLDESIRAIASAPLRTAAVSIAVGAWMGTQVAEAVSYRRRLAVLVLFIMPVAITTRWAGALRSGNYSAVDPAFMLTWFIAPLPSPSMALWPSIRARMDVQGRALDKETCFWRRTWPGCRRSCSGEQ